MSYITLYHYTDMDGAKGISDSEVITASTNKVTDAKFGIGTYLTDKAPWNHSKLNIVKSNWGTTGRKADRVVKSGRTDFVFTIRLRRDSVKLMVSFHVH